MEIELFERDNQHCYRIISIDGQQLNVPIERARSPIVLLPESFGRGSMKDAANIPSDAKGYCWLNGSNIIENINIDIQSNEVLMLLMGGLAYLDFDQSNNWQVKQINRFQPTEDGRFRRNLFDQ